MCYKYTVEYYSAIRKNEIMLFVATWMNLEIIILSEVSQTEKDKYHMISLICGILKMIQMNLFTKYTVREFGVDIGSSEGKASARSVGDVSSIPGSGRSRGEGNCNPLQCSCLENPMGRGAW